jgi:hypothetical protein
MGKNIFDRIEKWGSDKLSDIVYGEHEDIFVRHARRKEFERTYGNDPVINGLCPLRFAYIGIKNTINDPEIPKGEKALLITVDIVGEVVLDTLRVASVYGLYKLVEYTS